MCATECAKKRLYTPMQISHENTKRQKYAHGKDVSVHEYIISGHLYIQSENN